MTPPFIHPLSDVQTTAIGSGTRLWQFVVVLPGAQIGQNCNICSHCLIENDVVIGNRVTVKSGVQLWNGLRVGDDVFIGPNVTFTNDKHPKSGNVNFKLQSTRIGAGASIGGGATLLPGVFIGAHATVGAGAVVTKDVAPGATVIGNPARVIAQETKKEI
jgi:UDP-2-acetamido-3-amino-2,3-dideoxy-glucuronate N-acetyltransferase